MKANKMISSELIDFLSENKRLVILAEEDREKGNYFGASCLIDRYETLVEEELNFWHVEWSYAYSLGLIYDTTSFY